MSHVRSRSHRAFLAALIVVSFALMALVVNAGTVPHVHASLTPGVFNEDHDLSSLATLGSGSGLVPQTPSIVPFDTASPLVAGPPAREPVDRARRSADSRAPPVR